MINALIFRLPSKRSPESITLELQHMQICVEIDYTTICTFYYTTIYTFFKLSYGSKFWLLNQ